MSLCNASVSSSSFDKSTQSAGSSRRDSLTRTRDRAFYKSLVDVCPRLFVLCLLFLVLLVKHRLVARTSFPEQFEQQCAEALLLIGLNEIVAWGSDETVQSSASSSASKL